MKKAAPTIGTAVDWFVRCGWYADLSRTTHGDDEMADRSLTAVEAALDRFRSVLAEAVRGRVFLTCLYRATGTSADWPTNYDRVFKTPNGEAVTVGGGVYLHFDENDEVIYVGKAVSIGQRLGAYFSYETDRSSCRVAKSVSGSVGVRIVPLDPDIDFLAPALEWLLIGELDPPKNTQGRRGLDG